MELEVLENIERQQRMRNPSVSKECAHCGTTFVVQFSRKDTAKFCSRACSDKHPKKHNEVRCRECGSLFPLKKSHAERNKIWGSFCSNECVSAFRSRVTLGSGNANFKGRNFNQDGYRIYSPAAPLGFGLGKMKLHHAVALTAVGLKKIPKSMHVHHRDCNILNNKPSNLAFMTASDHKWIHKQFGTAVLNAMMRGDIEISELASWSDDPNRAIVLLVSSVESQGEMASYLRSKNIPVDIGEIASQKPVKVTLELVEEFGSTGA